MVADIQAANKAGGANTITLTAPATSPYVLTAVNNATDGPTGLPVLSGGKSPDRLTIVGNGDTIERSSASGTPTFRLLDVASGGSLTLEALTLENGLSVGSGFAAEGGAILNQGTLVLNGVTVQNNSAQGSNGADGTKKNGNGTPGSDASGGGLWSSGSLTCVNNTLIQNNHVIGGNGGAAVLVFGYPNVYGGNGGRAYGGGLYVAAGTANLTGVTFSGNSALGGNGGLGYYSPGGYVDPGGGGEAFGGGLDAAGGTATLCGDTIVANWVEGGHSQPIGYYNQGGGSPDYLAAGGGIYIASATVYMDVSTFNATSNNSDYFGPDNISGLFIMLTSC
jgi:hypothetical protein